MTLAAKGAEPGHYQAPARRMNTVAMERESHSGSETTRVEAPLRAFLFFPVVAPPVFSLGLLPLLSSPLFLFSLLLLLSSPLLLLLVLFFGPV